MPDEAQIHTLPAKSCQLVESLTADWMLNALHRRAARQIFRLMLQKPVATCEVHVHVYYLPSLSKSGMESAQSNLPALLVH